MSPLPASSSSSSSSSSSQVTSQERERPAIAKEKTTSNHNARNYRKLTQAVIDELEVLRPELDSGDLTKVDAAKKLRIPLGRLNTVLAALDNNVDPLQEKKRQRLSKDQVKLIEELLVKINNGEMTKQDAIAKVGTTKSAFLHAEQKLKAGEDPSETKSRQRITKELKKKIEGLIPKIDTDETTIEKAAKACNLSLGYFRRVVKQIKKGNDPSETKKWKRVSQEIADAVRAKLPEIKTVNKYKFADDLGISYPTLNKIIKDLQDGKDPLQTKTPHKLTKKDEENIQKFLPQIEKREMTYADVEKELAKEGDAPSIDSIQKVVANLKKGKSTVETSSKIKKLKEATKILKPLLPKIHEGTVSITKAAAEAKISRAYAASIIKDLQAAGKDPTKEKASSSDKSNADKTAKKAPQKNKTDQEESDDVSSAEASDDDDDVPLMQKRQKESQKGKTNQDK